MVPYMVLARDRPYMVLGLYEGNLEDLVEESVGDAAAFEASFKALKSKRKEAEKLPSFERVDCLTVSLAPLKAALTLTLTLTLSLTLTLALTLTLTLTLTLPRPRRRRPVSTTSPSRTATSSPPRAS